MVLEYEYKIIKTTTAAELEKELNELGALGFRIKEAFHLQDRIFGWIVILERVREINPSRR